MDDEQNVAMTAVDTSSDGPATPAPPLEGSSPMRGTTALDEINRKLDLLLQAQGISM